MQQTLAAAALALALFSPGVLVQPAWGPVYHWGRWYEGDITPPAGYFKQVSTGYGYTVGLRPNGSVEVWGDPAGGLPYDGVLSNLPAAGTWLKVEAGWVEAIALNSNGTVYVWGTDLTDPPFPPYYCDGYEITLDDCEDCLFSDVAAGENIMVGIVGGPTTGEHYGDLFIWGGILCFDPRSLSDDGYVDCGASPFVKVSCSGHHILAQKASGALVAIGNPLGDPDHEECTDCCEPPEQFNAGEYPPPSNQFAWWGYPPTTTVDLFSAGHGHSLVWTSADGLYGWGNNGFGQTGVITTAEEVEKVFYCNELLGHRYNETYADPEDRVDFEDLTLPAGLPVKIEGAKTFSTALFADGTLLCWGDNGDDHDNPSTLPTVGDGTYLDFSATHLHGAAISTCYADANADGVVDEDDLTYFQSLLSNLDISADCDESGAINTTLDWLCFYNLWGQGCEP